MRNTEKLAIHGGDPVRTDKMPPRRALGDDEVAMLHKAIDHYRQQELDPGYQGPFEKLYTDAFVRFMGGGYADSVATGTASIFVALKALSLPAGSEVLVSPITDPGSLSAIILAGLKPKLIDSMPGSYGTGPEQVAARIGPETKAALIVHSVGQAAPIERIVEICHAKGVRVVEDCAQAHGARRAGKRVGVFGDIAAFSTMYRKAHMTGASGGIVYSRDLDLFRLALAHADRGKPRWMKEFDDRNPNTFLFPAFNLHTDELSCAIGLASLGRIEDTIVRRLAFVSEFADGLIEQEGVCTPYAWTPGDSPFILPIIVDRKRIRCSKSEFAWAVEAEGIGLNPHYQYLAVDWPWLQPYLADRFETPNAREIRDSSFCLYLNENYGSREAADALAAIAKVERHYAD